MCKLKPQLGIPLYPSEWLSSISQPTSVGEDVENRELSLGMQSGATTVQTTWSILKTLKVKLPFDPAFPHLGIYPKDPEIPTQKNIHNPMLISFIKIFQLQLTFNTILISSIQRSGYFYNL